MKSILFADFLEKLTPSEVPLAACIHDLFLQNGCTHEIKESASGFTVSYISTATKKTVSNFVCRKTGLKIRITPLKPFPFDNMFDAFPENMQHDMMRAAVCKRFSDNKACNPRCPMGYDFTLRGDQLQKCRSMAFLFAVTEENTPHIIRFLNKIFAQSM